MSDIIFCATQFYLDGGYRYYIDFFKLVELSGYPLIPLSQLDPQSDNTYIITPLNDEWLDGWQQPKARIICLMVWAALILSLIGRNVVTDALAIAGVALWLHGFTGWRLNL
jgi:hypothetical protein